MSKVYGNLELVGGRYLNLRVEQLDDVPTFDSEDVGRLVYVDGELLLNNGTTYAALQEASASSNPVLASLGDWFNADLSFNPVPFNDEMDNVEGLSSTDSLFDVLLQLDAAITDNKLSGLDDIDNVTFTNLEAGDVIVFNGVDFANSSITALINSYAELTTANISDFNITDPQKNHGLFWSFTEEKFVNRRWFHQYITPAASSIHLVEHDLGQTYCAVTVINFATGRTLDPSSYYIIFSGPTQLTVVTNDLIRCVVVVVGVPT